MQVIPEGAQEKDAGPGMWRCEVIAGWARSYRQAESVSGIGRYVK